MSTANGHSDNLTISPDQICIASVWQHDRRQAASKDHHHLAVELTTSEEEWLSRAVQCAVAGRPGHVPDSSTCCWCWTSAVATTLKLIPLKSRLGTGEQASPSVCVCPSSRGRCRLLTCYSCYTVLPTHPLLSFTPRTAPAVTTATFPTRTQGFWVLRVRFQTLYCAKKKLRSGQRGGHRPMPLPLKYATVWESRWMVKCEIESVKWPTMWTNRKWRESCETPQTRQAT